LNSDFHTFCVRRFDRVGTVRRFYASAMTLLRQDQSEGSGYLDIAQFLRQAGDPQHVERDLAELFRRVVFNVAVGNRDDHLRNHGFLLGARGWRLAPAFDVNASIDKGEHVLNLDDADNRPRIATVLTTAAFYGLAAQQAKQVVQEVMDVVGTWRQLARQMGISSADIELFASAFSAHANDRSP
jgi:serine/threonine-protein kinase HipA